jgi:hypothetical protein
VNNSSQRNTLSSDEWDFKGIPQSNAGGRDGRSSNGLI